MPFRVIGVACQSALDLFKGPGRIRQLYERGRHVPHKYCLFNQQSPLRRSELKTNLIELIRRSPEDAVVFANCRDFFDLILYAKSSGLDWVSQDDCESILKDEEFIGELWRTVTSRPIQYRMQWHYVEARRALLALGVSEAAVPATSELVARETAGAEPRRAGQQQQPDTDTDIEPP